MRKIYCVFLAGTPDFNQVSWIHAVYSSMNSARASRDALMRKYCEYSAMENKPQEYYDLGMGLNGFNVFINKHEIQP